MTHVRPRYTIPSALPASVATAPMAPEAAAPRPLVARCATAFAAPTTTYGGGAAATGASMVLPMRATASVTVGGIMLPIVGGLLGAMLFGLPGAVIGAVGGYLLARR